jgi:quercetin dioxygenase-like cupin family protein
MRRSGSPIGGLLVLRGPGGLGEEQRMAVIDTREVPLNQKRPGWRGRLIHAATMTFAHWDFDAGADIHEHQHEQEEVWHVIDGELAISIAGETSRVGPGFVAIVPPMTPHSVRALSAGRAIVADHPTRPDF